MKKLSLLLAVLLCVSLLGCNNKGIDSATTDSTTTESTAESTTEYTAVSIHEHTFADWRTTTASTCKKPGIQRRSCTECGYEEMQETEKAPHTFLEGSNICKSCKYVNLDNNAAVVEMGNIASYESGNTANYVWDVHIWDGKIYRGAGDYDKNSGDTDFMAFNIAESRWEIAGTATDEAIHRYVEIDGKLYSPGIDSRDGGWALGNYYVLENGKWIKVRNVPNGIHCFDMIGFGGKMYLGVGTEIVGDTVAVSSDNGQSWTYVPLYKDNAPFDTSNYEWSRTCAFVEYKDSLYALLQFKLNGKAQYDMLVFRYENEKMVYEGVSKFNNRVSRNYWQSAIEWKDKCFIAAKSLYSVTDFSDTTTMKAYKLQTGKEIGVDALVYNDELYVLSYVTNSDGSYTIIIFKTSTGEADSFTEVVSFNYNGMPYSFDYDGNHFYVGIGQASANDAAKAGILLRVNPAA